MKRLLSILGMALLTTTSVTPVISCAQSEQKELTIHDQIKKSLQNKITFDDDWITDYSQPTDKIESWVELLIEGGWTFFNKLISDLIRRQLLKDVPDLLERYPDFSLSAAVVQNDFSKVRSAIKKHEQILFNYNVSYNLQQLQDIPFQDLLNSNNLLPHDNMAMIKFYNGIVYLFGQYKIKGIGTQNQISFNQKNFINDDKKRLNYLAKMLNGTTSIRAFNGSYRKFLIIEKNIPSVMFVKTDFPSEDLVKKIHADNNNFNINQEKILKNLKKNVLEDWEFNFMMQTMPTIFDDLNINISLVKAVLTSEIKADPAMNYVYGSDSRTYHYDMLVVNVKTTLKMGDIFSDVTIDEQLALDISYG